MNPEPAAFNLAPQVDQLADHAGGLVANLAQHNQDALAELQAPADALTTKIQGPALGTLASLEMKSGNIVRKLDKARQKGLGNAYQGIFPAGGSWQPIADVVAGLATGDIFGPVGLGNQVIDSGPTLTGGAGNDWLPGPTPAPNPDTVPGGSGPPGGILPPPVVVPPIVPPPAPPPPAPIPGLPPPAKLDPCQLAGMGHMNANGVCVPDFVGQWGPCPGGAWPDPVTGSCALPTPTCPEGMVYWPGDSHYPAGCYPASAGGGGNVTLPGGSSCNERIRVVCARSYIAPVVNNGITLVQPVCLDGNPKPPDPSWQLVTIEADIGGFGQNTNWQVWIPGAWSLCCDMSTGIVWAADQPCAGGNYCNVIYTPAAPPPPPPVPPPPGFVCDPIPEVPCPPKPHVDLPAEDNVGKWCERMADWIESLSEDIDPFGQLFGMNPGAGAGSGIAKQVVTALTGSDQPLLPQIVDRAKRWAKEVNRYAANASNCQSASMAAISSVRAAADFVQSYLHILPPQFTVFLQQAHNTLCQYLIPSPAEADRAYLADAIKKPEWECFQKAAGNVLDPQERLIYGQRTRPNAREVDLLFKRGFIDTDDYNTRMRGNGVLDDSDQQAFADLNKQFPDKSDLIRYMVRDVFDENVVNVSGLDTDFDLKYTGDALKYADALGLPEQHLRYAWRAHWQLPSLTMAGQMLARCRDGRVPDDAVVTEADVVQLLKQDDWAPKWIPSMMEILKQPLTRVDTRRMYQIHAATEDELKEFYLDLRYSSDDADKLVKFAKAQRDVAEAKASGLPTQRTAISQFARGELTSQELDQVLAQITLTPELAQAAKQNADLARTVYQRSQRIKGVKRQYVAGLIDDVEAVDLLLDGEVDGDEIEELLKQWNLERMNRGKHASAAQLCQWRGMNIINPADQLKALVRVGWSVDDANRIVTQCDLQLSEKARKAAERAAKESLKIMEKEQADALKALKARGKIPGPPTRRIVFIRDAKGEHETDTTTVPIIPSETDIAAAGGSP